MILSFYASLRLARKKNYTIKIAAFIILASLFSAVLPLSIIAVLYGPAAVLSFPFFGVWTEKRMPLAPPYQFSQRIITYEIRLLGTEVSSLNPQGHVISNVGAGEAYIYIDSYQITFLGIQLGSVPPSLISTPVFYSIYPLLLPLWVFMTVNTAAAALGFWISKMATTQKREWKLMSLLTRILLGFFFLGAGVLQYPSAPEAGSASFIFGITWLGILIGELVWTDIKKNSHL